MNYHLKVRPVKQEDHSANEKSPAIEEHDWEEPDMVILLFIHSKTFVNRIIPAPISFFQQRIFSFAQQPC